MEKCSIYSHFSAAYKKLKVLDTEGKLKTVDLHDVKAIFFVRDHGGDPGYIPGRSSLPTLPRPARW